MHVWTHVYLVLCDVNMPAPLMPSSGLWGCRAEAKAAPVGAGGVFSLRQERILVLGNEPTLST